MSRYARKMSELSCRIFGEASKSTQQTNLRVVNIFSKRPVDLTPEIVDYYPNHPQLTTLMKRLREYGLYRDEHQDFRDEMNRLRELRGKGRPKRGEGKRALVKSGNDII